VFSQQLAPVKTAFGRVFTPMQSGINSVGGSLTSKFDVFADASELSKENNKLKEEVKTLESENRQLLEDKDELERLRKLYKLEDTYANLPKFAATVYSNDPSNWYTTFCINKGEKDGIKVNMNVVCNEGLVGSVCEVQKNYSRVRTIMDDKSNVTAAFSTNAQPCNVVGDLTLKNEGKIKVEDIEKEIETKNHDPIYTAFDSEIFYPKILIGYVDKVKVDSNNVTKTGYVTPSVDFSELKTVLVITKLKNEENE